LPAYRGEGREEQEDGAGMADVLAAVAKQLEAEKAGLSGDAAVDGGAETTVETGGEAEVVQSISATKEAVRPLHDPRDLPPSTDGTNHFMFEDVNGFMWVWSFKKSAWCRADEQEAEPVLALNEAGAAERLVGAKRRRPEAAEGKAAADAAGEGEGAAKKKKRSETSVYFSGAPEDVTEQQVFDLFSKAGILLRDKYTGEYKMKLYPHPDDPTRKQGDGLVTYLREESVALALDILDGAHITPGHVVHVELPKFDGKKRKRSKKKKKRPAALNKVRYDQAKDLSWDEETRVHIVLKHMFKPEDGWTDVNFVEELKDEVKAECERFGPVEALKVFEYNPEGVISVKFEEPVAAGRCIEQLNGRWFGGQRVEADYYDGFTNYHVAESEEQKEARQAAWRAWLEQQEPSSDEE